MPDARAGISETAILRPECPNARIFPQSDSKILKYQLSLETQCYKDTLTPGELGTFGLDFT